jgi:superfamily II DNA or RNA helicase/very-short-patch-repair endonuclease
MINFVTNISSPESKIALFRSLFRGREDVYPVRFESQKTGRSGYVPACANEWVRGLCEKPRVKCSVCQHRKLLPVTDEIIRCHLSGSDERGRPFIMGVYPMLLDETCWFLALDFDGDQWHNDVKAVLRSCDKHSLPAVLERSRSGNGGHIWLFFEQAVPARLARNLGSFLLTDAMECRPEIGLKSYDRLFPNQDTLPKGGFGNLIALPLQRQARANGNSLFVDAEFRPVPDQWGFLSTVARIAVGKCEALVREAQIKGRITGVRSVLALETDEDEPWTAPPSRRRNELPITEPLPREVEVVMADQIYITKELLPAQLRNRLLRLAAFQNPEFYRAQSMRLPVFDKPRIIECGEDHPKHIALPRGLLADVGDLLRTLDVKMALRDERVAGTPHHLSFHGDLRPEQIVAANRMLSHDTGVLAATTAFGKTVLAAWLIVQRGVNALVLVHRQQLLNQWVERLSQFLGVSPKEIGQFGAGRKRLTGRIDVAIIQSLVRKGVVQDVVANYGHLVVDECHHLSAHSFELVARRAKARFVTGLSATVTRKDGHHPIIFMQCGPVRHRVSAKEQVAGRPFGHYVIVRPTSFAAVEQEEANFRFQFHALYQSLVADAARNQLICEDVLQAVRAGRKPLVLTERTEHLERLVNLISPSIPHLITLKGGMGKKELRIAINQLNTIPEQEAVVLIATGKFIGEGFDHPRLDTLFITLPISWRGTIAQYVGRLHRLHEHKREIRVYDYADLNIPMLARMFDRRCAGYESLGYEIQLPGSAVPGWPVEVPLPIAPEWKRDYAASVRRLILDGVDVSLADLFTHAAAQFIQTPEGYAHARSAAEAFLFRRLQTLPLTVGRFRLNARLPIQFDDRGEMEIDLLDAEARVAIELDGSQHLNDPEAYRRDRRKDFLLQENGYLVLRFLTEDVAKRLSIVLDCVLHALAGRSRNKS